mmetsp:Transcript_4351/g.7265  ORF Transcript_4351/g.7265 Transcript_4351/m.7265 type:complete len:210 (-) Transcript_4351:572-1201(-)
MVGAHVCDLDACCVQRTQLLPRLHHDTIRITPIRCRRPLALLENPILGANNVDVHDTDTQLWHTPGVTAIHCAATWEELQHLWKSALVHSVGMRAARGLGISKNKSTSICSPAMHRLHVAAPAQPHDVGPRRNLFPDLHQPLHPLPIFRHDGHGVILQNEGPLRLPAPSSYKGAPVRLGDCLLRYSSTALANFFRIMANRGCLVFAPLC